VTKGRLIAVRDELTRGYLSRCSLSAPVGCPSTVTIAPEPDTGRGLLHVDNYTTAGEDIYETMCAYATEFVRATGRSCRQTNNRIADGSANALGKILNLYRRSDLVLTSALHGCIIALAMGRRVLAVSGDRKLESFMESVGLEHWVCDINEIGALPGRLG